MATLSTMVGSVEVSALNVFPTTVLVDVSAVGTMLDVEVIMVSPPGTGGARGGVCVEISTAGSAGVVSVEVSTTGSVGVVSVDVSTTGAATVSVETVSVETASSSSAPSD